MADKITSTLAKEANGTIQINFVVPFGIIKKSRDETLNEIAKSAEIPGFRKGKAPINKVASTVSPNALIEKTLSHILPKALGEAIMEYKIKPATYPKFELTKAKEDEDWEIRAVTCELPEIILGNYKEAVTGALRAEKIWTPGKGDPTKTAPAEDPDARVEKEQKIIKTLVEAVKITIPDILINEEVDMRLSGLLSRIEKLGLNLDSYLASIGKTPESIREEYSQQAKESISLELILNKIAEEEKIKIEEKQIDEAITAASADPKVAEKLKTPEQRQVIKQVLARRGALDYLVSLV
jgi:FKBP-type peptidyl-prolyl cis-trans isomerase (trigger factor)